MEFGSCENDKSDSLVTVSLCPDIQYCTVELHCNPEYQSLTKIKPQGLLQTARMLPNKKHDSIQQIYDFLTSYIRLLEWFHHGLGQYGGFDSSVGGAV